MFTRPDTPYRDPDRPGVWSSIRRVMGDTDNPLGWSLPLYSLFGIAVRVHLLFVVYIVVRLLSSAIGDQLGFGYAAMLLASLFGLVLLHEYGHCFACRAVGGEADRILMWPLGGLASCRAPDGWKPELVTVLGGPGVNFVLVPVFGAAVYLTTGVWGAVVFDLRTPGAVLARPEFASWWTIALFWLHYTNLMLLLFNVLLPMFPMDGGRILQCILWARVGKHRSMKIATTVGLVMAVVVGLVALTVEGTELLLAIALFGGITCYFEQRRLKFLESGAIPGVDMPDDGLFASGGGAGLGGSGGGGGFSPRTYAADVDDRSQDRPTRAERREAAQAEKARERAAAEDAQIDAILAKISVSGRDSLTAAERRTLENATRRRQNG